MTQMTPRSDLQCWGSCRCSRMNSQLSRDGAMTVSARDPVVLPSQRDNPIDPPPELLALQRTTPVQRLRYPDGHVGWLVTTHELARAVLGDPRFSARSEFKRVPLPRPGAAPFIGQPALPGWFVDLDPPQHSRIRRTLAARFSVRRIAELSDTAARIVAEQLDDFVASVQRADAPVTSDSSGVSVSTAPADLVSGFALPVPSRMISELLGVPYADCADFQHNSSVLFDLEATAAETQVSMQTLTNYLLELVRAERRNPSDSLLGRMVRGGDLTDIEIAGAGVLLLTAGHETVASMLGLSAFTLMIRPSLLAAVRSQDIAWSQLVEELLRYLTIFQFGVPRTPLEEVELGGQLICVGETVTVSLPAANRDPAHFARPNELRPQDGSRGHVAFGFGRHQCIGQHLARLELRIGLEALFARLPDLALAVDLSDLHFHDDVGFYGVHSLPVRW